MLAALLAFIERVLPGERFVLAGTSLGSYLARGIAVRLRPASTSCCSGCLPSFPTRRSARCRPSQPLVRNEALVASLDEQERTELGNVLVQAPGYLDALRRKTACAGPAGDRGVRVVRSGDAGRSARHAFSFDLAAVEKAFTKPTLIVGPAGHDRRIRDAWASSRATARHLRGDRPGRSCSPVELPALLSALDDDWPLHRPLSSPIRTLSASAMSRLRVVPRSLLLPARAVAVQAQEWPTKPITVTMGFPAGSGVDVVARCCRPRSRRRSASAAGVRLQGRRRRQRRLEVVASARADGYTILLGTSATHGVNAALYKRLPFDVEADFTPIAPLNDVSNVLTINPDRHRRRLGARTSSPRSRPSPGKYNYASTGNGTGTHLAFARVRARWRARHGARALQGRARGDAGGA